MKKIVCLALTLCTLLALTACGSNPATQGSADVSASTAEAGNTTATANATSITIGTVGEPDTLVPFMFTADKDSMVQMELFDYLFETDEDGVPQPKMVESVDFDQDTLTYTWKIHENVKWSDGEPLTIDDVIFTLNALADPDYAGGASNLVMNIAGYEDAHNGVTDGMSGVKKVDDYTCSIQLSTWDPVFLYNFCDPGSILPEQILGNVSPTEWTKKDFAQNPVSYGPYVLSKWEHGEYIEVKKNPDYYGTPASIDTVIFRFAEEAVTFVNAFANGEIDMFKAPYEDVDTLAAMDFCDTYTCTPSSYPLYPNLLKGPLTDLAVRQAIMYSYDANAIAQTVFGAYGEGSVSIFCNSNWAMDKDAMVYPEDHEKAKSLLEEDGYTLGSDGYYYKDGQCLEFTALNTGGEMEDVLTMWQASLKKSGIKVNIKVVDWSVMVETISDQNAADYGTYVFGGGDADPSTLIVLYCSDYSVAKGGFNFNNCGDETLDALWYAGQAEMDQTAREEIYHEIDRYMRDNALIFPMVEKLSVWCVNNRVQNVKLNNLHNLQYLNTFTVN